MLFLNFFLSFFSAKFGGEMQQNAYFQHLYALKLVLLVQHDASLF
jgi:hypothetical protein